MNKNNRVPQRIQILASFKLEQSKTFNDKANDELFLYRSPWYSAIAESENKEIMTLLGSKLRKRVFECGCGIGDLFSDLSSHFESVFGCDISKRSLSLANEINRSALTMLADVENLPLQDESFDVVVFKAVLHHVPDALRALLEARKALLEHGLLIVAEPCGDTSLISALRSQFSNEKHFQSKELKLLLFRAGFNILAVKRVSYIAYAFVYLSRHVLFRLQNPLWLGKRISKMLLAIDAAVFKPLLKSNSLGLLILAHKISDK